MVYSTESFESLVFIFLTDVFLGVVACYGNMKKILQFLIHNGQAML